jgi:hypothetical protein
MKLIKKANIAAAAFFPDEEVIELTKLGQGHINDTFLISSGKGRFVLQRLNRQVFTEPDLVMANLRALANHLGGRMASDREDIRHRWEIIFPFFTMTGEDQFIDGDHDHWRMTNFVENAESHEYVTGPENAREAGSAMGIFHRLVEDLDPDILADTLPGFHVTPKYLVVYDRLSVRRPFRNTNEEICGRFIDKWKDMATVLEEKARAGLLPVRVIHGDPKLSNILFDKDTGRAVSIVDLDTVKPGLLHYDIGDCLRSCCARIAGSREGAHILEFDTVICRALLQGYFREMAPSLRDVDYIFIYPALRLMTFELGLRFFTDHLAGDIYFKTSRRGENLCRALEQFSLLESIEGCEVMIRKLIDECRQA